MRLLRSGGAGNALLVMAGSGAATVLLTRGFLAATGYPKISGGGLHIAHVLWGGLLMVAALVVVLTFLGRQAQLVTAGLGGAGFGLFIDEVGKFVTERTDYFYQPAAGLIYLAFAVLGVITFRVRGRRPGTARERTAEAARLALDGVSDGLTDEQRAAAGRLVEHSDRDVDVAVRQLLAAVPRRTVGWQQPVRRLAGRARTPRALVTVAVWAAVLVPLATLAGAVGEAIGGELGRDREAGASLVVIAAAMVSAVLGARAATVLRRDRSAALRLLHASLLVDLLIGQAFKFTVNQFAAATQVGLTVLVLVVLRAERTRLSSTGPATCTAPRPSRARSASSSPDCH